MKRARTLLWLATGVPVGAVLLVVWVGLLALGIAGLPVLVGLPILLAVPLLGIPAGAAERWRLRLAGITVDDPHGDPDRPGLFAWLGCRYREPATWRELAHLLAFSVFWPVDLLVLGCLLGLPLSLLTAPVTSALNGGEVKIVKAVLLSGQGAAWAAVPVGVLGLAAAAYLLGHYARLRAAPVRFLLGRGEHDVRELMRSRARLVGAFDAERRRIERDLHDGTQQRLVALGMTLGLARLAGPDELPALVAKAHDEAGQALTELQELIQGIHPRILTDRGLPAALASLADRMPVPVTVTADIDARLPAMIEACAYFVVSEALTNVVRHSGSSMACVDARIVDRRLFVAVEDDGVGGAVARLGGGLAGLADRVAAVGGRLLVDSPPGGPTVVRAGLPCG
ncbi:sensor histidine kinase [Virgisporangium ochraceum]|uniref:histidine kinase n=1 Tax=Virgisporangium ochraceum TaxID=65505 RepID=A0A8J3ZJZ2_9ACTN|nr:sensor histidine kinase [Virgisporangium ochraceum]GIJ65131.1 histidine kinase [Virgisporangium ochraceum]